MRQWAAKAMFHPKAMSSQFGLTPQHWALFVMTHWLYVDKTHPNQLKQKNLLKGQKDVLGYSKAGMQLSQEQMGTTRVCLCVCFIFLSFCSLASSDFLILLEKTSFQTAFELKCYSCDSPEIFIFVSFCATPPTPFSLSPVRKEETLIY